MVQSVPKPSHPQQLVTFGPFTLSVAERLLEKDGEAVRIGGRALDVLVALVERAGEIVTPQEILNQVWAGVTVAESGLRVHINTLRRALGDGQDGARFITTVAGRGYCFVAPVSRGGAEPLCITHDDPSPKPNLPPPSSGRIFGREAVVRLIADDLLIHRFITIVGPGGIGKTTVAASVGHTLTTIFNGNIAFADLGTIADPELVLPTVCAALKLPPSTDLMAGLLEALQHDQFLLILDCCEHVIGKVAALAEQLFQASPGCFLIATSREPLRVEGERLFHLSALSCPPDTIGLTATEALSYSAVQLFVERVSAIQHGFFLSDTDASVAALICRRVDGIALAIELAAGRVGAYGLREVAALLDGRIQLLWQGRRTAPPRQQTLNATLDWSFQLLDEAERILLCRLSVFVGAFTLDAARAVAADEACSEGAVFDLVASLVDKSLLAANLTGSTPLYRLLDVTRQYARSKVVDQNHWNVSALRHARYYATLLEHEIIGSNSSQIADPAMPSSDKIANILAALRWSFSAEGDSGVGCFLVSGASDLLLAKGLVQECRLWAETALSHLDKSEIGSHLELRLQTALATSLHFVTLEGRTVAFDRSIAIAKELNDDQQHVSLLYFRLVFQAVLGEPAVALASALESRKAVESRGDLLQLFLSDATLACIYSYIGRDETAKIYFKSGSEFLKRVSPNSRKNIDDRLVFRFRASEATNAFLCGFPDRAVSLANRLFEEMAESEDYILWGTATYTASFVFKWRCDWDMVTKIIESFRVKFGNQPRDVQTLLFSVLAADMAISSGDIIDGVQSLERDFAEMPDQSPVRFIAYAPLAAGLTNLGRVADALTLLDKALAEERRLGGSGFRSEFLLLKGEALRLASDVNSHAAEETLLLALEAAKHQTSLSRELKAATALAALLDSQKRFVEAIDLLAPIYNRFTEGFDTIDLTTARALIDRLQKQIA